MQTLDDTRTYPSWVAELDTLGINEDAALELWSADSLPIQVGLDSWRAGRIDGANLLAAFAVALVRQTTLAERERDAAEVGH